MKRRSFFQLLGGVTVAPFVPFRWAAGEPTVLLLDQSKPSIAPTMTPIQFFIDGREYTRVTRELGVDVDKPIKVTPFGTYADRSRSHLWVTLICAAPDWVLGYDPQELHKLTVKRKDGVTMVGYGRLTAVSYSAKVAEVDTTWLTFDLDREMK